MRNLEPLLGLSLVFMGSIALTGQKPGGVQDRPAPTALTEAPFILGSETATQWQGLLPVVNAPATRSRAYPGQHLTIAIGARGKERDQLLRDGTYDFTVTFGGTARSFHGLHPSQTRHIKNEGADFASFVMKELKADHAGLDEALSGTSLALFEVDWEVPVGPQDGVARIQGTVTSSAGRITPLKERTVEIWSFDRVAREGGFKDPQESAAWRITYCQRPEPSRLLHALRVERDTPETTQLSGLAFDVAVLKSSPPAAMDLLGRLKGEAWPVRRLALLLLSEAGYDVAAFLDSLPDTERIEYGEARKAAAALPDPYDLAPSAVDIYRTTTRMDMLWSLFLVTGDSRPVRAITQPLAWREDWKVFLKQKEAFQKTGKAASAMSIEVSRAAAYGASGWSLGSFIRTHPLVADFVAAWRQDPTLPAVVREELGTLLTNPAFKGQ
jgi:hypothetical protein